jgi:hypothetical protein
MVTQVEYSVAGRSRGRVTLCAVCTVHVETRSASFLVEPQNQGRRFVSGLASKPLGRFSLIWPQNRWLRFPYLGLKTSSSSLVICASKPPRRFLGLGLKTKHASVCRLCHKTNGRRMACDTCWSGGLLCLEASRARVSQSDLKTVGGTTMSSARGTIAEFASGSS